MADQKMLTSEYVASTFGLSQGWHYASGGDGGSDFSLSNGRWHYDFSGGAPWQSLMPEPFSLLGNPQEILLHLRGSTGGHRLKIRLLTHFMVFEYDIGPLEQGGHTLSMPAPPAEGWRWFGGENDGKLHGPLQVSGLLLEGNDSRDTGDIELIDIRVKATCPQDRTCVHIAEYAATKSGRAFKSTITSMAAKPFDARLHVVIRDWAGNVLLRDERVVKISPDTPAVSEIPAPDGRYVFLEAEFAVETEGQVIPTATACFVEPVHGRRSRKPNPSSPFGMGVYLYRYPDTPEGLTEMARAAEMARYAGVKWSREEFHWAMIETSKGVFDWSFYDKVVETAKENGISLYGILAYWSSWTKPYTKEGIEDYCRYAAACANRYKDYIRHWEIWNEPNIFFWEGPKEMYADLLTAAYAAIKGVNPDALVAGCSLAGLRNELPFVKMVISRDAPFDILTVHPYRKVLDDLVFINELREAADLAKLSDGRIRPVWITEMGWGTHFPHNAAAQGWEECTERRQAELIARMYIDALASGVAPNVSWYDFRCDGTNPFEWEHNLGIVRRDFSQKPAYRAFAMVTKMLETKRFDQRLDFGEGVVAFRFVKEDGREPVIALWGASGERTIELPAVRPAVVAGLMGKTKKVSPRNGRVAITVPELCPLFVT
jgi:hypothetical protein